MSESTLSVGYAELRKAIGVYLGITTTTASWSTAEVEQVEMVISSGLRRFYFPAPIMEDGRISQRPHEWSFLKPTLTMDTIAPYDTGTIAIAITGTTVTLTTGVWPAWTATHGSLIVDSVEYTIASRTDDTHIELDDAWTEATETAAEYTLKYDGNYDLPDDFAGMEGNMIVESTSHRPEIKLIGEGKIRSLRANVPSTGTTTSTTPYYAAVRPKKHETTTVGQRYEIMFYPLSSSVETISYRMRVLPQALVATSLEYPYGGMEHGETIRAACLAAAEEQQNGNRINGSGAYDKKKLFEERLAASIEMDKSKNSIEYFGYDSDNSDAVHRPYYSTNDRSRCSSKGLVTYESTL